MKTSLSRAKAIVAKFRRQKILVVGDVMLDRYIYGTVQRISPEAPVPVVVVHDEKNMPGGAANVARNVKALGARAAILGVIGSDYSGNALAGVMRKDGIETDYLHHRREVRTTVKMRIIAERQQVVRVDWDDMIKLNGALLGELCRKAEAAAKGASGIILADYAKGVVCQSIVSAVLGAARRLSIPVAMDPKDNRDLNLDGVSVITPNRKEAFSLAGINETQSNEHPLKDRSLLQASDILLKKWKPDLLVVTLGAQGMLVAPKEGPPSHVATVAREVFDVSGAGDTVIATMLMALAAGAGCREAAELANCAAGIVVGKIGTATCSGRELIEFFGKCR